MTDKEKYTTMELDLSGMSEAQITVITVLMNEGGLRENERMIAALEEYKAKYYALDPESEEFKHPIEACIAIISGSEPLEEKDLENS